MTCSEIKLKKHIRKLLEKGINEDIFPCAASGISYLRDGERIKIITYCGNAVIVPEKRKLKKNYYFDLASLTKPLATTMAILCLLKMKKIELEEKLSSLIEKNIKDEKKEITIRHLLCHSAGYPAHKEYFKVLHHIPGKKKTDHLVTLLLNEKLEYEPGTRTVYSDLGFMLLGKIIEKKAGCSLADFVEKKVLEPINLENKIFFNPIDGLKNTQKKTDFVATEKCSWRNKILCGEVHDDNCYAMGGISGHSGLFGNIEGVTAYAGLILDMWQDRKIHPNIDNKDVRVFLHPQSVLPGSSWALGFDTPAESGSSCGKYFSPRSVGHLGFTGTSFWIDPERDVVIVLLTNRVHPDRENSKIKEYRPCFHNSVRGIIFNEA